MNEEYRKLAREFMAKWIAENYVVKAGIEVIQEMSTGDVENMMTEFAATLSKP